ncbi:SDR family oxidoreductase [Endozoicomonas elysicola]|uniref:SDR family oxidoreductase n=1 Tax=Endozoicomonas elysicola TaxID=305900 RepID=UPI0009D98B96
MPAAHYTNHSYFSGNASLTRCKSVHFYYFRSGRHHSAGRMRCVEDMASVALFLASDESSFMYGSKVQADRGMNQTRWTL